MKIKRQNGFSLIELLIVVGIIGIIASIVTASLLSARGKARDVRRKVEIGQIGQFLSAGCFFPQTGGGEYDVTDLIAELKIKYPQYANQLSRIPQDPKVGTDTKSYYHYIVTADGKHCALYANLERSEEPITLHNIQVPTAGGGTGVFEASTLGWNGSKKYYQVSH